MIILIACHWNTCMLFYTGCPSVKAKLLWFARPWIALLSQTRPALWEASLHYILYILYWYFILSKRREEFKLFCFVFSGSWCACVAGASSPGSCVLHLLVQEIRRAGSSALLQPQATLPCLRNDGLEWGKSKLENVYFTTWWRLDALLTALDLPMAEHRNQVSK